MTAENTATLNGDTASDTEEDNRLVGPILRSGALAEAVIDAITEDNPDSEVTVIDRDDYVCIHTVGECVLRRETLTKHVGRPMELVMLEVEMPSFVGRMETRVGAYRWYFAN
jgi:MmoB/DmpM family